MKQGRRRNSSCLPHWWTSVIWRMPNWRHRHQQYKGGVVLRGDIVKDDSGSYALFTEQGSSASQNDGSKSQWISYPDCQDAIRQAADAVSAYTQIKMEDAPKLFKKSKIGMSRHLDSSTTTQVAKIMVQYGRPSRSSWTKSVWSSPLAGLLWERQFEKILLKYGWEKVSNWECLFVHREKRVILYLCMWMTSNWLEWNKILIRCGKYEAQKLMWENQHLSWIMYTWAALKDNAK